VPPPTSGVVKGQTWDLDGALLEPFQMAQRFYRAGFKDVDTLVECVATMYGESGGWLRAWHHNVLRDGNGDVVFDQDGNMTVTSTDLGLIQRNVVHRPAILAPPVEGARVADGLFDRYPEWADGQKSADEARDLWQMRGFQPWYAHATWRSRTGKAVEAVGEFLGVKFGLGSGFLVVRQPKGS
jgi:hypothetical protein